MTDQPILEVQTLSKRFKLHTRDGIEIPVLEDIEFRLGAGECLVLDGPSGAGKSTLLRCLYGNYLVSGGRILLRRPSDGLVLDLCSISPHLLTDLRRTTLGYVSQFLRVIPRVSAREIVAEPLTAVGVPMAQALERADALLDRLNLSSRIRHLPPATFSGGEQQRVNIARGLIVPKPVLLLDEPTASLDARNRAVVIALIQEARLAGCAIVGIFHDREVRDAVATRSFDIQPMEREAA
ncbi:MAG: phosphonate C-P lyase system protein PhnL [Rhodocyclaceae bacterium]|nr:phosphonate C-P lyase system protein PhnL [Rhodocyclaceae bacterium]